MMRTDTGNSQAADRLLRVSEVAELTNLARATIYKRMRLGDFPIPLRMSPGAVRWVRSEVLAFISSRQRANGAGERRADAA